jgi:predicted SprT family Zn-dependent metalloprotease
MAHWDKGWNCFLNALESLQPEQLNTIIYIRNEGHTVMEAINRQLAHYPYHIGQIVFSAKQLKNGDWESLSIPKNKSQSYNSVKFAQEKKRQHFTDEETNRLKNQ